MLHFLHCHNKNNIINRENSYVFPLKSWVDHKDNKNKCKTTGLIKGKFFSNVSIIMMTLFGFAEISATA